MGETKFNVEKFLRKTFKEPLDALSAKLYAKGVRANQVTIFGLVGTLFAAYLVSRGAFFTSGLVLALFAPLDAVDGALARLAGQVTKFGSFLDSFTDRYEEMLVLAGLAYYYAGRGNEQYVLITCLAMIGSVMVSYARAKAESLGFEAKIGILTRIERTVLMVIALLLRFPILAVGIIAVLANFTAWQRLFHVREQSLKE